MVWHTHKKTKMCRAKLVLRPNSNVVLGAGVRGWGYLIQHQVILQTSAGSSAIQLNSDTVYPETASDSTGLRVQS